MTWQWTPYTMPLLVATAVALVAGVLVLWRRGHIARSRVGALLLLAAAAWMLGSALELSSVELAAKTVWDKAQSVGICIIPTAWLAYALRYTGREQHLKLRNQILLSVVPLITFLLVITNEAHGLIWRDAWLETAGRFTVRKTVIGVGLWVYTAYSYGLIFVGLGVLVDSIVRSGRLHRWQAMALLAVVASAWLANLMEHVLGWTVFHDVDLTPFALAVTAPILAWAFYRLRRRGVVPVARDAVVEDMADALLVLDTENHILDLNPSAQKLLEADRPEVLGRAIHQLWPQWPDWVESLGSGAETSQEIALAKGGESRAFELHTSPLLDWRSEPVGQVVVFREITERLQAKDRLKAFLEEKEMLLETSAAITSTLDLGQLLLTLADQLLRVSGFSICSIYDWDQKAGEARTMAEHSHAVWSVDSPELFRIEDFPTTERVLTTGEPAVVHLGMDDPELIWMREAGLAAILMLPLYAGDQTIGLVEIGSPNSESIFDEATVLRCRQILQEAAPGFAAPFQDNPGEALLSLARQLLESSGASSCSISEWLRSRAEVRTAAEYSQMTWPLGQGPAWKLAEWPSVGRVLASRLPSVARLSDPDAEPLDREDLELYRARALVLLPILMKGEPIGFVEMYDVADERNVGHDELRLWQGVVSQAAVAIENAKLHAQVRKQLEVETALREAGTVFTSTLEPHVVLSLIAEQMGQAVDATSAYICGFDPAKMRSAVLAEYIGPQANRREGISDLGACYVEADDEGEGEFLRCMQTGQIDISQIDDPELTDTERAHMNEYGARTVLYIPLRVKGKLIGFTELWESRHRREFTADEIALCQAIAQNAAIALDNAQLYEQMEASLREKEVLLQEIHHRVKNNLQVISSLLNLQAGGLEDTRALDALRDSQGRVRSIALVHEKLYQSPDLAHIDFAAYTRELASALLRSYDAHTQGIALSTQIDDVLLGIDTAIPCGLILGELVSNALKHAFPGKRSGEITVGLRARSGETILTVGDDGIGLPADLDFRSPESLGLELVTTLVQQLDGTIELDGREGTLFKISFAPGTEERI